MVVWVHWRSPSLQESTVKQRRLFYILFRHFVFTAKHNPTTSPQLSWLQQHRWLGGDDGITFKKGIITSMPNTHFNFFFFNNNINVIGTYSGHLQMLAPIPLRLAPPPPFLKACFPLIRQLPEACWGAAHINGWTCVVFHWRQGASFITYAEKIAKQTLCYQAWYLLPWLLLACLPWWQMSLKNIYKYICFTSLVTHLTWHDWTQL